MERTACSRRRGRTFTSTITHGGNPAPHEPNELVAQYEEILDRAAAQLDQPPAAPQAARLRRPGRRLSDRAPRHRRFHAARGPEDLLARAVRRRAQLRRGDGADRPRLGPRRPDSARQPAVRLQLRRSPPHPHDGDGVDRRLRPGPAADAGHAGADSRPRQQSPLGIHQPGDRHRRPRRSRG